MRTMESNNENDKPIVSKSMLADSVIINKQSERELVELLRACRANMKMWIIGSEHIHSKLDLDTIILLQRIDDWLLKL